MFNFLRALLFDFRLRKVPIDNIRAIIEQARKDKLQCCGNCRYCSKHDNVVPDTPAVDTTYYCKILKDDVVNNGVCDDHEFCIAFIKARNNELIRKQKKFRVNYHNSKSEE